MSHPEVLSLCCSKLNTSFPFVIARSVFTENQVESDALKEATKQSPCAEFAATSAQGDCFGEEVMLG
jgi:hypothetical protein